MAIATSIRSFAPAFNTGLGGWVNLSLLSTAGISAATPLTITPGASPSNIGASGAIIVTPYQELPFNGYKCRITTAPTGPKNYLIIRAGDTVTG